MQNPAMARALGVDTGRVYMLTFSLGAGLAGFSGALFAPTVSIAPFMGQQFVAPAFITVVVGGATNVIVGAVGSSLLLSLVKTPIGFVFGAFVGTVALLLAALVIIRLMPDGVSAVLQRRIDRRDQGRVTDAWLSHLLKLLTGPEDIGRSRWFWARLRRWSASSCLSTRSGSANSKPPTTPITYSMCRSRSGSRCCGAIAAS